MNENKENTQSTVTSTANTKPHISGVYRNDPKKILNHY